MNICAFRIPQDMISHVELMRFPLRLYPLGTIPLGLSLMGLGLESCFVQFVKVGCSSSQYSVLGKVEVCSCSLGGDNILGRHQR